MGEEEGARERWESERGGGCEGETGGRDGRVGEEEGGWDGEKAILELLKCLNFQVCVYSNCFILNIVAIPTRHSLPPCSPSCSLPTPGYHLAMSQFILKKFLLLVLFLDHAKLTRLIDHDPCLFQKDAHAKVGP